MVMVNITKLTEEYIAEHPSIKDCLKKGMINYSSLTRQICKDQDLDLKKNFDAVLIACRRYYRKVGKEAVLENKIIKILKDSKLEVKNKIVVFLVEKNIYYGHLIELQKEIKKKSELFHIIEGSSTITVITSHEFLDVVKKLFKNKIMKVTENLAEITLKSSEDMENTPGIIAYLSTLLADNGINITETMSTWTDTLFVIDEKDIAKVMELLRF
jgi:predicted regulator of amino acid metabolism with ACT domain|tara:strand:- start:9485 stop:10126 length:642 start_codon:yes stop_codon:yes gene_type:complete